jgi:hypothetical protein
MLKYYMIILYWTTKFRDILLNNWNDLIYSSEGLYVAEQPVESVGTRGQMGRITSGRRPSRPSPTRLAKGKYYSIYFMLQ